MIPLIDISAAGAASAWDDAMRRLGFVLIEGHGVDAALTQRLYDQVSAFFARPLAEKVQFSFAAGGRGQGYLAMGSETVGQAAGALPDLCESLTFADPRFDSAPPDNALDARLYRANLWPDGMPELRATVTQYMAAGRALALRLMRLSAVALDLPADHFAPFYDKMNLNLRCVLYPDQAEAPRAGQLRNGPHTDFSGFTILRQDGAPGGLQVKAGGGWIDVAAVPGTFVINAGDLIQRWTNDRWLSNVHRVANPPRDAKHGTRRLSLVLFTGPNSDAGITCLPTCTDAAHPPIYPPIVAGLHSEERMRQTYGARPS
ncbi:MAG TPA: 2OG-Fe(II) oxygenase family protein [Rhizomicrobium sp.]|nr:2OG-Fe(II) oxygenase family protein [Rhizomicrobium sp.]